MTIRVVSGFKQISWLPSRSSSGFIKLFDGYYTNVPISAFGTNSSFSIDQVGYY